MSIRWRISGTKMNEKPAMMAAWIESRQVTTMTTQKRPNWNAPGLFVQVLDHRQQPASRPRSPADTAKAVTVAQRHG